MHLNIPAVTALILYVRTCWMFWHFLIMSVVNETTLLWLSSKEENDRNCVTLERFGMALLILEFFYQRLFSLGESNDIDMLPQKVILKVTMSHFLNLGYPITTSLSF